MRYALFLCICLLSACVSTAVPDRIPQLLIGREVVYDGGAETPPENPHSQTWAADGTTVYRRPGRGLFSGDLKGRWTVEGGRYCAYFGNQTPDQRDCWWVSTSDNGARIRFKKSGLKLIDFGPDEFNGRFVK